MAGKYESTNDIDKLYIKYISNHPSAKFQSILKYIYRHLDHLPYYVIRFHTKLLHDTGDRVSCNKSGYNIARTKVVSKQGYKSLILFINCPLCIGTKRFTAIRVIVSVSLLNLSWKIYEIIKKSIGPFVMNVFRKEKPQTIFIIG